jgi:hypothetical protein
MGFYYLKMCWLAVWVVFVADMMSSISHLACYPPATRHDTVVSPPDDIQYCNPGNLDLCADTAPEIIKITLLCIYSEPVKYVVHVTYL